MAPPRYRGPDPPLRARDEEPNRNKESLHDFDRLDHLVRPLRGEFLALEPTARELLFTAARTPNSFTDEPVSDEQLRAIWELAKWPPTSANTNPMRVLYLRTEPARERLIPHLAEGNRDKSASAPVIAVLAYDTQYTEHVPRLLPFRPEIKEMLEADPVHHQEQARFNSALQAGYFLLSVRAAGLTAGPLGGFDAAGVDREFFPEGRLRSFLVVNIGRPGDNPWFERLPRLEYEEAVRLI
ncbi:malonic semialdehyde reductase [Streptomyces sp. AK02-01A]|uniref:malonic semialdehyde reductase n=1 Tax=Streptomyces sp. AK02-01A TaxID=3028648 RepID=UPI0029A375D1|nr:malonic semialdehyde reductase [Streptomyces sp. AK02-01A]MDX3853459.1 malonic semialdehyde reductase [Streptomyces sp. AK02-01A]